MSIDKRRSERVMLTIPLHVQGEDAKGDTFVEEARTVTLNRHGARIRLTRRLKSGQTVRVQNILSRRETFFRVVGPVTPQTEKGGEWGIELLDGKENIWGIGFPPAPAGADANSSALLECRKCHTVSMMKISLVEVEVLETSGILTRICEHCESPTPWGYAEAQVAMGAPTGEEAMMAEGRAAAVAAAKGAELRRYRRVALQLPVLVRDYYGGVEVTKSENVSKGGFCFVSEKKYHVGEGLMVACPHNPSGESLEIRAHIVRRQTIEGTMRSIYGVRYTQTGG